MKTSEFRKLIREEVRRVLNEGTKKVGDRAYYGDDVCTIVAVFPNLSAAKKAVKVKYPKDFKYHFEDMDSSVEDGMAEPREPWYELKPKDPTAFYAGGKVKAPTIMVSGEDID
jgi:hypothetical protein